MNSKGQPELKPCPFCGSKAEVWISKYYCESFVKICCTKCFAETDGYKEIDEAYNAWNMRVNNE